MKAIIFILLLMPVAVFSQVEIAKSSLAPGGGMVTKGSNTVIYSVGELAVQEVDVGDVHLSEGFIGKTLKSMATKIRDYAPLKGVRIFPNPVYDVLFVDLPESSNYLVYVFDVQGKLLINKKVSGKNAEINMGSLRPAVYLILITDMKNRKKQLVKVEKQ